MTRLWQKLPALAVIALLDVPRSKIAVCPAGFPEWGRPPRRFKRTGYLLFVGSLEPRKNLARLLTAYEDLVTRVPGLPKLVLAGRLGHGMDDLLERTTRPPLAGHVDRLGYVSDSERQSVYDGARALVDRCLDLAARLQTSATPEFEHGGRKASGLGRKYGVA